MSQSQCANQETDNCKCTYAGCPRHGRCCECLSYHLVSKELPGCCFSPEVEKSYDRSFTKFIATRG